MNRAASKSLTCTSTLGFRFEFLIEFQNSSILSIIFFISLCFCEFLPTGLKSRDAAPAITCYKDTGAFTYLVRLFYIWLLFPESFCIWITGYISHLLVSLRASPSYKGLVVHFRLLVLSKS